MAKVPQGLDHRLLELKSDLAACEANISALESELSEKDNMLARLEADLIAKDSVVNEQGNMLAKNMTDFADQVRVTCLLGAPSGVSMFYFTETFVDVMKSKQNIYLN